MRQIIGTTIVIVLSFITGIACIYLGIISVQTVLLGSIVLILAGIGEFIIGILLYRNLKKLYNYAHRH